ncbi:MAG: 16S rRNA (guanine(527)-N(7))-methyltransferase RsmG [Bacilli bacterium]|nr:16S rRNA (guanine(527)-N(7))-methyltransferase RsmG [Bacilli bacterium]
MKRDLLINYLTTELNISSYDEIVSKFSMFEKLLLEWNEKFNLTAITDEDGILEKHFIDSIVLNKYLKLDGMKLCDIGTGAGFPGIPLAILNRNLSVTLVESNGKRIKFLQEVKKQLSLENVEIIQSRSEELKLNEHFDIVCARAVTELNVLLEITMHLIKVNGLLVAYKLFDVEDEVKHAEHALHVLDAKISSLNKYSLPLTGINRCLVLVKKYGKTKKKYPRQYSEICKSPL